MNIRRCQQLNGYILCLLMTSDSKKVVSKPQLIKMKLSPYEVWVMHDSIQHSEQCKEATEKWQLEVDQFKKLYPYYCTDCNGRGSYSWHDSGTGRMV